MGQTTVECKRCENDVVPKLWHKRDCWYTKGHTEHLCPMCGHTMYETREFDNTGIVTKITKNIFKCYGYLLLFFFVCVISASFIGEYLGKSIGLPAGVIVATAAVVLFRRRKIKNENERKALWTDIPGSTS